jgi:hypothetical protein
MKDAGYQAPPEGLSPREQEIWREAIPLVPEWSPLFRFPFERYCYYRADLERLDAEFASGSLSAESAQANRKLRRERLSLIRDFEIKFCLRPAWQSELN